MKHYSMENKQKFMTTQWPLLGECLGSATRGLGLKRVFSVLFFKCTILLPFSYVGSTFSIFPKKSPGFIYNFFIPIPIFILERAAGKIMEGTIKVRVCVCVIEQESSFFS